VPSFVHIDWEATIDKEARVWSVIAVIVLYIFLVLLKIRPKVLAIIAIAFFVLCGISLGICYHYSGAVPNAPVAVANQMIDTWHTVFILADVFAVCAGMSFGMWLAS
jgi:hypothetical protein